AGVEPEAVGGALLDLERGAVIVRAARVRLHEEVAYVVVFPSARVEIRRLAGCQDPRLNRVKIPRMTWHPPGSQVQVSGRDRDASRDLMGWLDAGLVAVGRLKGPIERVGEPETARRRDLARHQERARRAWCRRSADGSLLEASLDRRDRGEQELRVG